MTKQELFSFLNKNIHAVISTCGTNQQPEAALIGFGETENLEIIFGTFYTSKKYRNIQENNKVAFATGWEANLYITVQYEGTARELKPEELDHYLKLYHTKVPSAAHYHEHPEQRYFLVTPTWIRYSDLSGEEEKIVEFTF
jgi:pyridoxine/pyridoxamine 5'-phosphate oxidase